jgi:hypothetical protein
MEALMDDQAELSHRLVLVIDDDAARVRSMAVTIRGAAAHAEVFVVDESDGRAVVGRLAEIRSSARIGIPVAVIVRAAPTGWTAAVVLASLRWPSHRAPVDVVIVAEGTLEMLPLRIADFPGVRLAHPHEDPHTAVANLLLTGAGTRRVPAEFG